MVSLLTGHYHKKRILSQNWLALYQNFPHTCLRNQRTGLV